MKDFYPVAEFIDPGWGDKVNSGIGLSTVCRTGPLGYMDGGPVRQPYAEVNFIPQSGIYEFIYRSIEPFKENILLLKTSVIHFSLVELFIFAAVSESSPDPSATCFFRKLINTFGLPDYIHYVFLPGIIGW
jgi:hypothetical protein